MKDDSPIQNVSDTAFMVAVYRAQETARPDALFRDPLAAKVAGDHGRKIVERIPKRALLGGWSIIIRTRMIDDFILNAIAEGVDTVLNLGAGLDTRPYRMDLPASLRWVEADYPRIIDWKTDRLKDEKPRCQLERVGLDLSDATARRKFLDGVAAKSKKILVLTEAVILYLPEEAVASLGADLRAMPSVRYWIADYFSPASYRYRRRSGLSRVLKHAPFLFEPADYFGFFKRLGWEPKEIRYFGEEAHKLKRPAPFPLRVRLIMRIVGLLASAERKRDMGRFAGYVMFEPGASLD